MAVSAAAPQLPQSKDSSDGTKVVPAVTINRLISSGYLKNRILPVIYDSPVGIQQPDGLIIRYGPFAISPWELAHKPFHG